MKQGRIEWLCENIDYEQIAQKLEQGFNKTTEVEIVYIGKGTLIIDLFYDLDLQFDYKQYDDVPEERELLSAYIYLHNCEVFWQEEGEQEAEHITQKIDIDENELEEALELLYR